MTTGWTWSLIAVGLIATMLAGFSANRVPVRASMAIALATRVGIAALASQRFTPFDTRSYFRMTAEQIGHRQDPLHDLPGRQWNFLELMPYVHALELHSGLPWVYAVKIAPIMSDVALVWLVARLATADPQLRALQYALNPLSWLIVSVHGQVEPIALALSLAGILLIRQGHPVLGGVLLGAAVAAKTWPVVVLVAILPWRHRADSVKVLAGAVLVPAACLLSGVLWLDTQPGPDLHRLVSYSSYVSDWTWSGLLIELGHTDILGYNSSVSGLASVLIAVGVGLTLLLLRDQPPARRALAALCSVLIFTAGFGTQYLLWVLPLSMALSGGVRYGYLAAGTGFAALSYLQPLRPNIEQIYLRGLSWLPALMLIGLLAEQLRRTRSTQGPDLAFVAQ